MTFLAGFLTEQIADSYSEAYGKGFEAGGNVVDCGSPADTYLMSASAGPGRTWLIGVG
jgi:hypothetical protein